MAYKMSIIDSFPPKAGELSATDANLISFPTGSTLNK